MQETERLESELLKHGDKSEEFRQQLQSFRKFKERMVEAGVYRENRYTIPLMHRLGHPHNVTSQTKHPYDS